MEATPWEASPHSTVEGPRKAMPTPMSAPTIEWLRQGGAQLAAARCRRRRRQGGDRRRVGGGRLSAAMGGGAEALPCGDRHAEAGRVVDPQAGAHQRAEHGQRQGVGLAIELVQVDDVALYRFGHAVAQHHRAGELGEDGDAARRPQREAAGPDGRRELRARVALAASF